MHHTRPYMLFLLGVALLLSACITQTQAPAPPPDQPSTQQEAPVADVPTATPLAPTAPPQGYYIQPGVPQTLVLNASAAFASAGLVQVATPEEAAVHLVVSPQPEAQLTADWVYVVAAPFATVPDGISLTAVSQYFATGCK